MKMGFTGTSRMSEPVRLVAMLAAAYRESHEVPTIRMPALRMILREYLDISRHVGTSRKLSQRRHELQGFLERLYELRKASLHARKASFWILQAVQCTKL